MKSGLLQLNNPRLIEKQRSIGSYVMKQMGKNLLSGQSIMSVSLPVGLSCPESYLERCVSHLGYAPIFLEQAAQASEPLEQFKLSLAFLVSRLHLGLQHEKPFNPILGETLQCYLDGNSIFAEQISHHPPVSAFQLFGNGYKVWGLDTPIVEISMNGAKNKNNGYINISFENTNLHIIATRPILEISVYYFLRLLVAFFSRVLCTGTERYAIMGTCMLWKRRMASMQTLLSILARKGSSQAYSRKVNKEKTLTCNFHKKK